MWNWLRSWFVREKHEDPETVIFSLQRALAEATQRAEVAEYQGVYGMSLMLWANGGDITISREIVETVTSMNVLVDIEKNGDNSITFRLTINDPENEADDEYYPDCGGIQCPDNSCQ